MEFLSGIKQNIGNRILNKKLRIHSRVRETHNLNTAKTAGILFTPTDQISFEQIKQFLTYLNAFKLQIYVLGYIDSKTIPETFLFWKGINLFSRKDLNWTMTPNSQVVTDFIGKPFDILFDLSLNDYYAVSYISKLSKSKFKIGRFTLEHDTYDLMFEIPEDKKLEDYLEDIKHYVNMIQ